MEKAAKAVRFKSVKVVILEKMSLKEQMTITANTRIMVGVQGAGLQWATFMSPGSTFIEISCPQKYWYPFYGFVQNYNIKYIKMTTNDVQVNWRC